MADLLLCGRHFGQTGTAAISRCVWQRPLHQQIRRCAAQERQARDPVFGHRRDVFARRSDQQEDLDRRQRDGVALQSQRIEHGHRNRRHRLGLDHHGRAPGQQHLQRDLQPDGCGPLPRGTGQEHRNGHQRKAGLQRRRSPRQGELGRIAVHGGQQDRCDPGQTTGSGQHRQQNHRHLWSRSQGHRVQRLHLRAQTGFQDQRGRDGQQLQHQLRHAQERCRPRHAGQKP